MTQAADGPTCTPPGGAPGWLYSLVALTFIAHTIAEIVGLPDWAAAQDVALDAAQFGRAALGVMGALMAGLLIGRSAQMLRPVQIMVAGLLGALLANVAAHLGASLVFRSLTPGTLTAVFLVLPLAVWLLKRVPLTLRERALAGGAGAIAMPVIAGLALHLAA